ncbi:flagellar protein FliT [Paenibacillus sp. WQ 127069]|uniref:Flagellar protein FliT n=1 Tax=Paenibacillus baimaensis TaxID=2982185 RepID=A0ABT2UFN2_9BACL|nr:flagellar protein FliT [Paenibacillus sp. WQ 127069]MCU6792936.1 flagellar protein FliT [Paenibacillus sp. WQ 127069]
MYKVFEQLENATVQMVHNLENATFESLVEFVEQRDLLVEQLRQANYEGDERERYSTVSKRILQHDAVILAKMQALQDEAALHTNKFTSSKKQKSAYEADYTFDGVYMDRRK